MEGSLGGATADSAGGSARPADRAYLGLVAVLLALMVSSTLNGIWGGDFWEHAAVVRELITHLAHPRHPLFDSTAPNAFFSPYSVALAGIARIFGLGPITILSLAGIGNLLLLCFGLRRFTRRLFPAPMTPFYALLFMILLWGSAPWEYSGFLHLGALGYVLPYPSTFATGLVFLVWAATMDHLRSPRRSRLVAVLLSTAVVLLTHPLSAIVLVLGVGALAIGYERPAPRRLHDLAVLAVTVGLAAGVAVLWPYYPLLRLVLVEGAAFHQSNQPMYAGVLAKTYPAALGLLPLAARLERNRLDPLVLLFVGLLGLYLYGFVTGQWSYGRVIAFLIIIPQLGLAGWVAETTARFAGWRPIVRYGALIAAGCLVVAAGLNFREALARSVPGRANSYARYEFLARYTGQYDVVLSDPETSWFVPPFGGKVVANRSMAFIDDRDRRLADVDRFFDPSVTGPDRTAILDRYGVDFVLLNRADSAAARTVAAGAAAWGGAMVYSDDRFELLRRR